MIKYHEYTNINITNYLRSEKNSNNGNENEFGKRHNQGIESIYGKKFSLLRYLWLQGNTTIPEKIVQIGPLCHIAIFPYIFQKSMVSENYVNFFACLSEWVWWQNLLIDGVNYLIWLHSSINITFHLVKFATFIYWKCFLKYSWKWNKRITMTFQTGVWYIILLFTALV